MLLFDGCRKKEETWQLTGIEIVAFPLARSNGENWDDTVNVFSGSPCDTCKYPDLRIKLNCATNYTSGFRFTDTIIDASGSTRPWIPLSLELRKETWTFELYDYDPTWISTEYELMSQGNFDPHSSGWNGIITVQGSNGAILDFHYTVQD